MFKYLLDCTIHKMWVFVYLAMFALKIIWRGVTHDLSKYSFCEASHFSRITHLLKKTEYGSEEYRAQLRSIKPAIIHHNQHNRHHPEFHKNGIRNINVIDFIELLADWKAASKRNKNGDVKVSIEKNQERFGYSDDIKSIMKNSL